MTSTLPLPLVGIEPLGFIDRTDTLWSVGRLDDANDLLAAHHYLGPSRNGGRLVVTGVRDERVTAAQIWRAPTARNLPADGTWLELSRWCLTPDAGANAGSRMHRAAVSLIKAKLPRVTSLVSYSDPSHGHTGALYRACNWHWAPTWHRLRPPPTGNGDWGTGRQATKDRWVFAVAPDARRLGVLTVSDAGALRHWRATATDQERAWAARSPYFGDAS